LFSEIEAEFSGLYQENLQLRTKISALEKGLLIHP
jgi:WD40 repeat protein